MLMLSPTMRTGPSCAGFPGALPACADNDPASRVRPAAPAPTARTNWRRFDLMKPPRGNGRRHYGRVGYESAIDFLGRGFLIGRCYVRTRVRIVILASLLCIGGQLA